MFDFYLQILRFIASCSFKKTNLLITICGQVGTTQIANCLDGILEGKLIKRISKPVYATFSHEIQALVAHRHSHFIYSADDAAYCSGLVVCVA